MDTLADRINQYCDVAGRPLSDGDITDLPVSYRTVLLHANGFSTRDGVFRLFGTERLESLPNIYDWNESTWRKGYGDIFDGILVVAEDIFGDQYGYERESSSLVKVFCEGGERQVIDSSDLVSFLKTSILVDEPNAYDVQMVRQAFKAEMRPRLDEHLAFELPLIANGEYDITNLHVESTPLHLGVLGQMSLKNRGLPDGTPIRHFT
ncbi:MAG: hypothetical protein KDB00_29460 [Planctomycetales bacterium]|nr:hypothetical protein [Planctomycetales bacterium]